MGYDGRVLRALLLRIGLVAASLLGVGITAECGVRLLTDPPRLHDAKTPLWFDPILGFRGIPNYVERRVDARGEYAFALNDAGFRGRDPSAAVSASRPRLVFVGDSFVVGRAVREEELMSARVEARSGRDVFNLGLIDSGTGQQLLLLDALASEIEPDAIVLVLYPANDVVNNSMLLAGRTAVSAGDPVRPYVTPVPDGLEVEYLHPVRARLRGASRLFLLAERRWLSRGPSAEPLAARSRLLAGRAPAEDLELFREHSADDPWERAWPATERLIVAMRDAAAGQGARFLVLVVPSVHQVMRNARGVAFDVLVRETLGRGIDDLLDWNRPERRLERFFEAEAIDFRMLVGPLREAAATDLVGVYLPDEHLGHRGQRIAADAVVDWLAGKSPAARPMMWPGPIETLPVPSRSPSLLDFTAAPHAAHLGNGWLDWTEDGWRTGQSSLVVVRPATGRFVLRGRIPAGAPTPVRGTVTFSVDRPLHFEVERPGDFSISRPFRAEIGSDAYSAIVLSTSTPVVVEQIGFDTRR